MESADTLVLMTYLAAYCMAVIAMYVVLMPQPGDPGHTQYHTDSDSEDGSEDDSEDVQDNYQAWIKSMALRLRIQDVPAVRP